MVKIDKEQRNRAIVVMHEQGQRIDSIAHKLKINKAVVYKIIRDNNTSVIDSEVKPEQGQEVTGCSNIEAIKEIDSIAMDKVTKGILIESFENWDRIGVNQYYSKVTNQVINIEFIAGTPLNGYVDRVLTV